MSRPIARCGFRLRGLPTSLSSLVHTSRAPFTKPSIRPFTTCKQLLIEQVASSPSRVRLRDYQEECIQSVLASLDKGHKRLGISLATGSGKTVIFTHLIDRIQPLSDTATQTLILAHRRELVEQAARHCTSAYPERTVELELGKLTASGTADITIASLQSITSRDRLLKFDPSRFKLVLVDEAHHIVAPGYLKVLKHFGLSEKQPSSPHLVGVSATFSRFDGLRLGAAIDEIVYHKDYVDMIGDKWLTDVIFTTVETKADLSGVKKLGRGGSVEFEAASLSRAVNTDEINEITIKSWFTKAKGRKSTLVFCVDLDHLTALTQKFRRYGVDARFVTGDTPPRDRSERLEAFKRGEFPVLVNCGVFTEGTDIPNVDCVLLARPTRSRGLLVQMIGRGMRLHPGKENCQIIDMVSSLDTGIVTTPTLFGLDPSELVSDATVDQMEDLRDRREAEKTRSEQIERGSHSSQATGLSYNVTLTEYDSVFDLLSDTSGERHIRTISKYAWVQVSSDRYILCGPTGTFLRLEKESSSCLFECWEVRALPPGVAKSPFAAPRKLLNAETFADAVRGCDNYAKEVFPHAFIWRRASWRQGPATEGQLKFLNRIRTKDELLQADDITKGQAADMITKLKHGARGRFASLQVDKRKRNKLNLAMELEQARRLGEFIAVGPVLP